MPKLIVLLINRCLLHSMKKDQRLLHIQLGLKCAKTRLEKQFYQGELLRLK